MRHKLNKRPALTSPWKIGIFVALLLFGMSFWAGYYIINVYDVNLKWLGAGANKWSIDSELFFKEMYPLAAGVILVSVIGYILVASAVRRYKVYLDSGQDYRKMIAVAESIDDLTNPAQIAKLSDYPELQSVLRNYGDRIREISNELDTNEENMRSVDLEMEVESLLRGENIQEALIESKWWGPLFKKIQKQVNGGRRVIKMLKEQNELDRHKFSGAVLAQGKVLEGIGAAGRGIKAMEKAADDLNGFAGKLVDADSASCAADTGGPQADLLKTMVCEMENSLHKLEDSGRVLHQFSEDNNGLALNIALMAARGEISDQDLARVAEKVRGTAESFKRLSGTITSIAQSLLGNFFQLKQNLGGGESGSAGQEFLVAITGLSGEIREKTSLLQLGVSGVEDEVMDVYRLLQGGLKRVAAGKEMGAEDSDEGDPAGEDLDVEGMVSAPEAENDDEMDDSSDLVIEHGKVWKPYGENGLDETIGDPADEGSEDLDFGLKQSGTNMSLESVERPEAEPRDSDPEKWPPEQEAVPGREEAAYELGSALDQIVGPSSPGPSRGAVLPETEEKHSGEVRAQQQPESEAASEQPPAVSGSSSEGASGPPTSATEGDFSRAENETSDPLMEMPGHKWLKIDVEKSVGESERGPVEVEVESADTVAPGRLGEDPEPAARSAVNGESLGTPPAETESESSGQEPVYDLFELGAVEYVEETSLQK